MRSSLVVRIDPQRSLDPRHSTKPPFLRAVKTGSKEQGARRKEQGRRRRRSTREFTTSNKKIEGIEGEKRQK